MHESVYLRGDQKVRGMKVLIVDDEPAILKMTSDILTILNMSVRTAVAS